MTRAHFHRPIQDPAGNIVLSELSVTLLTPGTADPITETIFRDAESTDALDNPFPVLGGVLDFYLADPQVVTIQITQGESTTTYPYMPVGGMTVAGGEAPVGDFQPAKNAPLVTLTPTDDIIATYLIDGDGSATAGWPNRYEVGFQEVNGEVVAVFSLNEYGEVRLVPAKDNTTALRIFARQFSSSPARSATAPLVEVQSDRTTRVNLWSIFGDGRVEQTRTPTDAQARWITRMTGALTSAMRNVSEHYVAMKGSQPVTSFLASWLNEWGALRGTSPYSWGDSLVRAIRTSDDGITGGNFIELSDRRATPTEIPWAVNWKGEMEVHRVKVWPVYVTADWASDPNNPANGGDLPAGIPVVQENQ